MANAAQLAINWTEQGLVPDPLVRAGIRRLLRQRLTDIFHDDAEKSSILTEQFVAHMRRAPIAIRPEMANTQHYEVPSDFFGMVLGPHRKYSSCFWTDGTTSLADAESAALTATCERAGLRNGMDILELGCGWGSLTLWMASHYPDSMITAVSNSRSQRQYILEQASARGLRNLDVVTADMNEFRTDRRFDRVVSVEMFEHMRNWPELFARVHDWLKNYGRFFMHVFVNRQVPYAFEARDDSDWMSRHFFTGGMMPSDELATRFQDHLKLVQRWRWDGTHYEKTANAWLANLDRHRPDILQILASTHGAANAEQWFVRWRLFFMACAELFGYSRGQEWWVSHYLFERN